ncbi:phage tail protein [Alteriqipengyuania lutimaris]|uniref:Tip attachment protein J domain-containing protein n=1 Tax=Alteriqipengyuania lutimaris TaxID=1538146 RepID=A0A395LKT1_9SPHN|nr:hypothetical protein [Alteriqipengyuania lutimaris]MBB3034063.1 hypothetical protein [Alteriqipengyuania lutimaris]RDS76997.1 hypothetical protein DL238_04825 [Alteriqipengyuania lutimaris]
MSGALGKVATIAGVVALGATGIGAFAAAGTALAATAASVTSIATVITAAASVGAQLTAKEPPRIGSVTDTILAVNPPQPYLLGRTYFGGVIRHEIGYGPKTNDVENPFYFRAIVAGGGGPYEALESVQVDYKPVAFTGRDAVGYYNNWLFAYSQLGQCPEPSALAQGTNTPIPGWGASAKLSGQAAQAFIAVFDKKGKRFASGMAALGGVWLGALNYDPRKDGTLPNGSGDHRQFVESTYEFSKCPAVQAVTYAMGRVQNGKLTMGVGIGFQEVVIDGIGPVEGIWWDDWAAFANVCDANGWEGGGVVYEGEGAPPRWDNLKDICAAGGGIPVVTGGKLGVVWQAPRVAVDTISAKDLAGAPVRLPSSKSIAERVNAITPKFASEAHQWEFVPGDEIVIDEYVAADKGEKRSAGETQINLCNKAKQAAELCTYKLARLRERGPIEIPCGPRMRRYRIGTCLVCADDMADYNLAGVKVVVIDRTIDFQTMTVNLLVETESDAKHALALGRAGTAPPVVDTPSAEERDGVVASASGPASLYELLISTSSQSPVAISATDTTVTIGDHERLYSDKSVAVTGDTIASLDPETTYYLFYEDPERAGGAVIWQVTEDFFVAQNTPANPARHYGGYITTDTVGGSGTSGGGALPPGSGGRNPYEETIQPQ